MVRFFFEPQIVDSQQEPANSIRGNLVYEKKSEKEDLFPSDRGERQFDRVDVRTNNYLKLSMNTSETRKLFEALKRLHSLSEDMNRIPAWNTSYVEVNGASLTLLNMFKSDASAARALRKEANLELVKELLNLLTQSNSREGLLRVLSNLQVDNLHQLSAGLSLELLERAITDIENDFKVENEEFWQNQILEKYPWIIGRFFSSPCILLGSKVYLGGNSIENRDGNEADFTHRNEATSNVSIFEIKKLSTRLPGGSYRGRSYSLS